jgi:hypothetical protein
VGDVVVRDRPEPEAGDRQLVGADGGRVAAQAGEDRVDAGALGGVHRRIAGAEARGRGTGYLGVEAQRGRAGDALGEGGEDLLAGGRAGGADRAEQGAGVQRAGGEATALEEGSAGQ